ncbi:MAG: hypothetical protein ACRBCI_12250 [Cellvibrionaceae bacterium]
MFEQLDDDYFDDFYQRKAKSTGMSHQIIDVAALSLSSNTIEYQSNLIFSCTKLDGLTFYKAVVGFEGVDCFLLTCQCNSQIKPETYIQCSSLLEASKFSKILSFVLSELKVDFNKLCWVNTTLSD